MGKTVPSHVVKATALTHIDVQDFPEHRLLSYASVAVVQQCLVVASGEEIQKPRTRKYAQKQTSGKKERKQNVSVCAKLGSSLEGARISGNPSKLSFSEEAVKTLNVRVCCLTRVEKNDSFEADKLLGL